LPRDPLEKNYEYAANLGFSAANFTPLTQWADAISSSVQENPLSVVDCQAEANAAACLEQAARAFVARAFRGIADETQLARFASFFSASVAAVGAEQATADLVNLTLTSPGYVFRDEVQSEASGRLLPAQRLQHLSYTLADSPPEAVGLSVPAVGAPALADADFGTAVDQVLATPAARAKLLRFFLSWLEVKEPGDFDISTTVFPYNNVAGQNTMGRYYSEKFAGLLSALKSIDDGDGHTGLYNSSIILAMECWSESSSGHYLRDIPFVLAGQGGGAFQTGRVVDAGGRSNNDLLVSVQRAAGIASDVFGLASLCEGPIV
jgi:hypothetical protein